MFGGSSKHLVIDGEILDKSKLPKLYWRRKKKSTKLLEEENSNDVDCVVKKEEKKSYRLNKSKVKKKCHALSRLEKSKKFLAFYSISFPVGLPDENAYKIFNTWLTRCRRNSGLKTYLWVAERQKNGTVHFHLLTNDFMPIKQVNDYMTVNRKKKYSDFGKMKRSKFGNKSAVFSGTILQ